jgi:hypothetical protein
MHRGFGITAVIFSLSVASIAQAALIDRGNGLVYDDVLNVTWQKNANLAASNSFGLAYNTELGNHPNTLYSEYIRTDGSMTWGAASRWVNAMNASNYLGYTDWRLPTVVDTGTTGCNYSNGGTDCGFNPQTYGNGTAYSEMAYMYFVNLGLTSYLNPNGSQRSDWGVFGNGTYNGATAGWPYGENTVGLIEHLRALSYWTGTENLAANTYDALANTYMSAFAFDTSWG